MREKEFKPTINPVESREVDVRPRSFDAESEFETTPTPPTPTAEITQELPSETNTPEPMDSPTGSGFPPNRDSIASGAVIDKANGEPVKE